MKNTILDNPDIIIKDKRILNLNRIVEEVKQSEEWEVVKMSILDIGIEKGMAKGMEKGIEKGIEKAMKYTIEILKDMGVPDNEIKQKVSQKFGTLQEDVETMVERMSVEK